MSGVCQMNVGFMPYRSVIKALIISKITIVLCQMSLDFKISYFLLSGTFCPSLRYVYQIKKVWFTSHFITIFMSVNKTNNGYTIEKISIKVVEFRKS